MTSRQFINKIAIFIILITIFQSCIFSFAFAIPHTQGKYEIRSNRNKIFCISREKTENYSHKIKDLESKTEIFKLFTQITFLFNEYTACYFNYIFEPLLMRDQMARGKIPN